MNDPTAVVARMAEAVHGDDVLVIDELLALLPDPLPAHLVRPLLETLVDEHEFPEVLWGIMHAAESVSSGPYERGLLDAFPTLTRDAPGWARLLLLRCMNSPTALAALASLLPDAPLSTRTAVSAVAEDLRRDDPNQFADAADAIASAVEQPGRV